MIYERRIGATLTILDINDILSNDIDSVVLSMIKTKFEKICYMKSYIHKIIKIINVKDIECNQTDISNCSFNVDVVFAVECENVMPGEVITDMKILSIKKDSIILGCDNKIAVVKNFNSEDVKNFSVGSVMPVRNVKSIYEPRSTKIKIGCSTLKDPAFTEDRFKKFDTVLKFDYFNNADDYNKFRDYFYTMPERNYNAFRPNLSKDNKNLEFDDFIKMLGEDFSRNDSIYFTIESKDLYGKAVKILNKKEDDAQYISLYDLYIAISNQYVYRTEKNNLIDMSENESMTSELKKEIKTMLSLFYKDGH